MPRSSVWLVAVLTLAGCATASRDRAWLDAALRERLGHATRGGEHAEPRAWPDGADPSDGVDEDEAVAIALWRSPAYRAELTRLDAARATLDEASRPANPQLTLMGPLGPITAIATLLAPLESLWQLPQRTEAASRELESVAEALVMSGLDLARDVLLAHAELGLAVERERLRAELAEASVEVARIGDARERLGDSSALESSVARADALVAADAHLAAIADVEIARARLAALLALDAAEASALDARFVRTPVPDGLGTAELVEIARACRPDVRAAELAVSAAASRAGWERGRVLAIALQVDGQWADAIGPALRIGGRIELAIFSANEGGIGRADAEVARASARLELTARTVVLDVTLAASRARRASRSLETFRADEVAALEEAVRVARQGYASGDETYLPVLDALRRSAEARLREAELRAESRRARAELERALGARLEVALTRSSTGETSTVDTGR